MNISRREILIVVLSYLIVTVVMTYPIAFRLDNVWLASRDIDTTMKLWDHWWFARTIATGGPLNFTPDLFHPLGLDLTYHSISWTVTAVMWLLAPLMGNIAAYDFTILIGLFTTALGAYWLIRSYVYHPAAAWLGGAIYSFIPYHLTHAGSHPDLTHMAGIPLAILFFSRALSRSSWKDALIAAFFVATVAFTGLYLFEFTAMTLLPAFIYGAISQRRWRTTKFWKILILFGVASAVLTAPRTVPLLQSSAAFSSAIEEKFNADATQTDLLALITPSHFNPIFAPVTGAIAARFVMNQKWPGYLGLLPLVLIISAATWRKRRLLTWVWLLLGLIFTVLALGPALRFNGELYENISLPYAWLAWFPLIRIVGRPDYFMLGLMLPLAVVAALGFDRWLDALAPRPRIQQAFIVAACAFLLFEYWNGPYPGTKSKVDPIYQQLAQDSNNFALIELPMGRRPSKDYLLNQVTHQHPIVEGLSGRTLPEAYTYIDANALLSRWRAATPLSCEELSHADITAALSQLNSDGFRYVIVHHDNGQLPEAYAAYFTVPPRYADDQLSMFAVADLSAAMCP